MKDKYEKKLELPKFRDIDLERAYKDSGMKELVLVRKVLLEECKENSESVLTMEFMEDSIEKTKEIIDQALAECGKKSEKNFEHKS